LESISIIVPKEYSDAEDDEKEEVVEKNLEDKVMDLLENKKWEENAIKENEMQQKKEMEDILREQRRKVAKDVAKEKRKLKKIEKKEKTLKEQNGKMDVKETNDGVSESVSFVKMKRKRKENDQKSKKKEKNESGKQIKGWMIFEEIKDDICESEEKSEQDEVICTLLKSFASRRIQKSKQLEKQTGVKRKRKN
jgi:hypothetical protein